MSKILIDVEKYFLNVLGTDFKYLRKEIVPISRHQRAKLTNIYVIQTPCDIEEEQDKRLKSLDFLKRLAHGIS